eukprot:TRINITY_DN1207_c0_g1_i18.p1 TRINITY_DN1207_c0_g1~~TRINITY_DN1207_c0_g1_i18.p1  ORF type:complete len:646 (+),score=68.41 TRINITY_DN1207_c0_g1_i18:39-1940(+)
MRTGWFISDYITQSYKRRYNEGEVGRFWRCDFVPEKKLHELSLRIERVGLESLQPLTEPSLVQSPSYLPCNIFSPFVDVVVSQLSMKDEVFLELEEQVSLPCLLLTDCLLYLPDLMTYSQSFVLGSSFSTAFLDSPTTKDYSEFCYPEIDLGATLDTAIFLTEWEEVHVPSLIPPLPLWERKKLPRRMLPMCDPIELLPSLIKEITKPLVNIQCCDILMDIDVQLESSLTCSRLTELEPIESLKVTNGWNIFTEFSVLLEKELPTFKDASVSALDLTKRIWQVELNFKGNFNSIPEPSVRDSIQLGVLTCILDTKRLRVRTLERTLPQFYSKQSPYPKEPSFLVESLSGDDNFVDIQPFDRLFVEKLSSLPEIGISDFRIEVDGPYQLRNAQRRLVDCKKKDRCWMKEIASICKNGQNLSQQFDYWIDKCRQSSVWDRHKILSEKSETLKIPKTLEPSEITDTPETEIPEISDTPKGINVSVIETTEIPEVPVIETVEIDTDTIETTEPGEILSEELPEILETILPANKQSATPSVEDNLAVFMQMRNVQARSVPSEKRYTPLIIPPSLSIIPCQINSAESIRKKNSVVVFPQNICPYRMSVLVAYNFLTQSSPMSISVHVFIDSHIAKHFLL